MNKIIEIWEHKIWGRVRLTYNPCHCHPNDLMKESGKNLKKAVTYTSVNKSSITKRYRRLGYVRLC